MYWIFILVAVIFVIYLIKRIVSRDEDNLKNGGKFDIAREIMGYVAIIVVIVLIRTFVVTPIKVNGDSMNDTLYDGEIMLLKKYEKDDVKRFDIVVLDYNNEKLIKRIVGMPKEDIEYKDGELLINGEVIADDYGKGDTEDFVDYCGEDEYFVLGDNRENSVDSRMIGCISVEDIDGTSDFIIYPFNKWGKVNK